MDAVGPGVIKLLILDRGFIDGAFITEMKRKHGIDVLIPLKSNMTALDEALRLITHFDLPGSDYNIVRDENGKVVKRIATHVYFILLVYTRVQLYLNNAKLSDLTSRTVETLRQEERLGLNAVIVYAGHFFAVFDLDEYTDILLHLRPAPLERMRKWIKLFRQSKTRPPP